MEKAGIINIKRKIPYQNKNINHNICILDNKNIFIRRCYMKTKIIPIEHFLEQCEKLEISAFEACEDLDIILSSCKLDDFFKLCKLNNTKFIFYKYYYPEKDDYLLDEEDINRKIREYYNVVFKDIEKKFFYDFYYKDRPINYHITNDYHFKYLNIDEFESIKEGIIQEISSKIVKNNKNVNKVDYDKPIFFETYFISNGFKVGIESGDDIQERYDIEFDDDSDILDEYKNKLKKLMEIEGEKIIKKEREYIYGMLDNALIEVEKSLQNDEKLLKCKTKTSREDYSRKIQKEWQEKMKIKLMQVDIREVVDKVYFEKGLNSIIGKTPG